MVQANNAKDIMAAKNNVAELGLIVAPGADEQAKLIDQHLTSWSNEAGNPVESFIVPSECPRFSSGDGIGRH